MYSSVLQVPFLVHIVCFHGFYYLWQGAANLELMNYDLVELRSKNQSEIGMYYEKCL
jgi:hypothetical protein